MPAGHVMAMTSSVIHHYTKTYPLTSCRRTWSELVQQQHCSSHSNNNNNRTAAYSILSLASSCMYATLFSSLSGILSPSLTETCLLPHQQQQQQLSLVGQSSGTTYYDNKINNNKIMYFLWRHTTAEAGWCVY